jgi:hypothetical protein
VGGRGSAAQAGEDEPGRGDEAGQAEPRSHDKILSRNRPT